MANFDLSQLLGTSPDASTPTAGAMPQQPLVPQQFPINNPILKAAQGLGGALQGNPNVQGGPPVGLGDMLPSIPRNKLETLMMLAGPALGVLGKAGQGIGGAAQKIHALIPGDQGGIGIGELRDLANLPKGDFNKAVMDLFRKGHIDLDTHDAAHFLTDSERAHFTVPDGKGNHYVMATKRQ